MKMMPRMALAAISMSLLAGGTALAQDYTLPAAYGEITLNASFSPDPYTVDVVAGGTIDASTLGPECRGYIANAPDFQLTYTAGSWPLYFSVLSEADTTLVINGPDGAWHCNDDYDGFDPAVIFGAGATAPGGTYDIWVGTYGSNTASATLYISELSTATGGGGGGGGGGGVAGGPDYTLPAAYGEVELTAGFTPDPMIVEMTAGGGIDAYTVDPACRGYIATAPDYQISYTSGTYPLIISVLSQSDTTLVINGPNGAWYCNDDTNGLNPVVRFDTPATGTYDIWVGTYGNENAPATLYISELAAGGENGPVTTGPNPNLPANYGELNLTVGFPPAVQQLAAGGTVSAFDIPSGECRGYIAEAPDLAVNFTNIAGLLPLTFAVESQADTTLVIMDPAGNYICNDDTNGANPVVEVTAPQAGRYLVWVGTYSQDPTYPAATLTISTVAGGKT
ncbi:MAG: hypothetical protein ACWA6X_09140 [Bauldia sp.]